ncbi:MAG: DNA-directed RNA polymerase subunit delta [Bacilli bacterium]|nr:DNA-directed RNA polymerase subunit delta [Bacilli bacterium]
MSIRKKDILDLELMSYSDIAYEIIKEDKKQYNTPNLFKEVCKLLNLSDEEFEEKIGDFFTALSTDQRFIFIDSVNWDLKENHVVKVVVDEGEDDMPEDVSDDEEDEDEEEDNDDDNDIDEDLEDDYSDDDMDDRSEDDLEDLTILDEDEIEE